MSTPNKVELLGHYGGDYTHAQSGWCSTNREMTPDRVSRIPAFLHKLATGSGGQPHGSPYEKSMLHFFVEAEVASHIHLLKHRIGVSVNAESARYQELFKHEDDRFYLPPDWPDDARAILAKHSILAFERYHELIALLVDGGMTRKRAKESARFILPYNTILRTDVSFNFRSFVHFLALRRKGGAQDEIHWIADQMVKLVRDIPSRPFQHSLAAWGIE